MTKQFKAELEKIKSMKEEVTNLIKKMEKSGNQRFYVEDTVEIYNPMTGKCETETIVSEEITEEYANAYIQLQLLDDHEKLIRVFIKD